MPSRKSDNDTPVTPTPVDPVDQSDVAGSVIPVDPDPTQAITVDGKTVPAKQADTQALFGDARPPNLPPTASGNSQNATTQVAGAQRSADAILSGQTPNNNLTAAAQANDAQVAFDADSPDGSSRVNGALTRNVVAAARGPHFFTEQVDNVFLCDVLVYICGADVTPHLKGQVQWSYGQNDQPNNCSFTLDNSNDKFSLTPENIRYNHFHAGTAPNEFGEYDESAKAKIYQYKNNQCPLPVGSGFFSHPSQSDA